MKKIILSSLFLCSVLFFACPSKSDTNISDTDWQLQSWTAGELPDTFTITATFADGRLTGKGVCNQYFADATIEGNKVSINTVGATKMLCPEHSDIERKYFEYLQQASTFKVNKGQLELDCGGVKLVFVQKEEKS